MKIKKMVWAFACFAVMAAAGISVRAGGAYKAAVIGTDGLLLTGTDFENASIVRQWQWSDMDSVESAYLASARVSGAGDTFETVDDPTASGHGKVLHGESAAAFRGMVEYSGMIKAKGTYTVVFDVYASKPSLRVDMFSENKGVTVSTGHWETVSVSFAVTEDGDPASGPISLYSLSAGTMYLDNIYVYFRPADSVLFDNGSERVLYTDGETLSVPAPSAVDAAWSSEDFLYWSDGDATYPAGTTASAASLASKTMQAVYDIDEPAGLITVPKAQLHLQGAPGMRVAAFVDADSRARSVEYGFIVARKAAFDSVGGNYETYLVFPRGFDTSASQGTLAIGKPFSCGVAYKPDAEIDLVYTADGSTFGTGVQYERDFEKGGLYYVGVLTGQDGYAQYKDDVVARPYLRVGTQYFYGAPIVRNIYDLASTYKAGGVENDFVETVLSSRGRTYGEAYSLVDTPSGSGKNGLANGWDYDNRFELDNVTGTKKNYLYDDNDTTFTALRRSFNAPESDGLLHAELLLTLASSDGGAYIAYEDENGERIAELTENGGKWALVGTDTVVSDVSFGSSSMQYAVLFDIDFDKHTASASVNGNVIGAVSVASGDAASSLALGTNAHGTGSVTLTHAKVDKNYPVLDRFLATAEGAVPASWTTAGSAAVRKINSEIGSDVYSLKLNAEAGQTASASREFEGVYGKVDVGTFILLPEASDGASFALTDGTDTALTLTFENGYLTCGGTTLHEAASNVWHEIHVIADTDNGGATVKIDGKTCGSVAFDAGVITGMTYTLAPTVLQTMWIDDLSVKCVAEQTDYPSAPVKAVSTNYNIGINFCNLYRDNQASQGWDTVSAFAEYEPVTGYYDEGSPELADWEIKFLAEHGVDFMQVCWYAPYTSVAAPIKRSQMSHSALHDGYMNAKYSDDVKFAILWENAYEGARSVEQFKTYIWPYWKAYYFSDSRYMTLDGKALLSVYNRSKYIEAFGSEANAKAVTDFMDTELKAMGYDGLVLLFATNSVSGDAYQSLVNVGGDGTFAYGWGVSGYSPYYQKQYNERWSSAASTYGAVHLPTVSTGYSALGINSVRGANITSAGFRTALTYAKSMLDSRSSSTWKSKTLFLSNWNEFFEGTVIFPTLQNGFGYLDAVRSVFTAASASHTDAVPTSSQKARINRMYPQDRASVARYDTEDPNGVPNRLAALRSYSMATANGVGAWEAYYGGAGMTSYSESTTNGWITGTANTDDYSIGTSSSFDPILAVNFHYLHIRMSSTGLAAGQVYFITTDDTTWNEAKKVTFDVTTPDAFVDYYVKMNDNEYWTGTIKAIRIDPVAAPGTFRITDIDFMYLQPYTDFPTVTVNGRVLDFTFHVNRVTSGGTTADYTVCAEPFGGKGFFSMMRLYHEWDRHNGLLTLKTRDGDEFVFTVGSNIVIVNGTRQSLGYTFSLYDGLPVFRIGALCDLLGYDYDMSESGIVIYACTDAERALIEQTLDYRWEFNSSAEIGSWTTRQCTVSFSGDGCMTITSTNTDPGISHVVNFAASDRPIIRIGFRYTPSMDGRTAALYFASDTTGGFGNDNSFAQGYDALTAGKNYGDLVVWEIDTSTNVNFAGNITALRFDPCWVTGDVFRVDFIRCVRDDGGEKGIDVSSLFN